eukprot:CAMPEP_0172174868 /NCGR_PEP_ID=MMETSP1050-20130122/13907_1 /TAXON_ID=233186 /ORGANISM="Cryptomonas curvata, Strain CCAP979/52" /LENGTH=106 /DNA_ID=CAMNT_0012846899 /DNA_START=731 /DNA_END=1052 /DNA_ORIENTATION=-
MTTASTAQSKKYSNAGHVARMASTAVPVPAAAAAAAAAKFPAAYAAAAAAAAATAPANSSSLFFFCLDGATRRDAARDKKRVAGPGVASAAAFDSRAWAAASAVTS